MLSVESSTIFNTFKQRDNTKCSLFFLFRAKYRADNPQKRQLEEARFDRGLDLIIIDMNFIAF